MTPTWMDHMPDIWVWNQNVEGVYSAKCANKFLRDKEKVQEGMEDWKWVWKLKVSSSIQFFIWQVCHRAILVRSVLKNRRIIESDICLLCNYEWEIVVLSVCLLGVTICFCLIFILLIKLIFALKKLIKFILQNLNGIITLIMDGFDAIIVWILAKFILENWDGKLWELTWRFWYNYCMIFYSIWYYKNCMIYFENWQFWCNYCMNLIHTIKPEWYA